MADPDPLPGLKRQLLKLSPQHQRSLLQWLQTLMVDQPELQEIPTSHNRQVLATQHRGQVSYQHELVRCGKEGCKCATGELHGPYWYAYFREAGKMHSVYVGKTLKE